MATQNKKNFADKMAIRRTDNTPDGLEAILPTTPADVPIPAEMRRRFFPPQRTTTNDGRKQITFKLPTDVIDSIRAMSYWERVEQWQFVADAVRAAVKEYERKNGKLEPIPER